ncbi:MAG: ribose-phosphate pyrophosphokinase-like domain-containing protein, partial [Acidobacteriaceae bacterium]|nr:ribose-phosphate pyrophosphokinase-like domain-containing protein [Acidobacteriaceae bacterium]
MSSAPKPARSLFTEYKVFSGTANPALASDICKALGAPLGETMIKCFADGETHLQIQENVRGA